MGEMPQVGFEITHVVSNSDTVGFLFEVLVLGWEVLLVEAQ